VNWRDDHTQDVARKRQAWDAFAAQHGGTCRLIATPDHVYQRLELTVPRPGCTLLFGESDKQNWQAVARGAASQVEPFQIAPRGAVDQVLRLFRRENAAFADPTLRSRLVVTGTAGRKAVEVMERPSVKTGLLALGDLYLTLLRDDGGFSLRARPDPIHGFEERGTVMLEVLDGLVEGLRHEGVLG
jgi:hypothetical protein